MPSAIISAPQKPKNLTSNYLFSTCVWRDVSTDHVSTKKFNWSIKATVQGAENGINNNMSTTRSIGSFEVIQSFFPFHHNSIIFYFTNQKNKNKHIKIWNSHLLSLLFAFLVLPPLLLLLQDVPPLLFSTKDLKCKFEICIMLLTSCHIMPCHAVSFCRRQVIADNHNMFYWQYYMHTKLLLLLSILSRFFLLLTTTFLISLLLYFFLSSNVNK